MPAPDKATEIKALVVAVIAFLTALWGWVGWAVLLFGACIVLDYLTGTWAAKARGEWSSAAAREGLWHKLGEISALLVASLCDIAIQVILSSGAGELIGGVEYSPYLTVIVCAWYIFTELGSILENAKKLGAPIPAWLIQGVNKMKEKTDRGQTAPEETEGKHVRKD